MGTFEEIESANREYVAGGRHRPLPVRPSRHLAIVTCMDSRIDAFDALGLRLGEAHVIRSAGARVTDDVLRSLTLSTHVLGTREVIVVGHTDCGLSDPDGTLVERLSDLMGHPPVPRDWGVFRDPHEAVAEDCERLAAWTDRPDGLTIGGYVLDVATGALRCVVTPGSGPRPVVAGNEVAAESH
jgi:carbonic anhydrase